MPDSYTLCFRITLLSDASPGSGFGGEVVNHLIYRDSQQRPAISGSHIKGLIRQNLADLFAELETNCRWDRAWLDRVLGSPGYRPGLAADDKLKSRHVANDALFVPHDAFGEITPTRIRKRTAIDSETGTVVHQTLRASEFVCAGVVFEGQVDVWSKPGTAEDDLLRLGLLSITSVGAQRTRGAGKCKLKIADENRTPLQLLQSLQSHLTRQPVSKPLRGAATELAGDLAWLEVFFIASSRVLVPEYPETLNVIRSGFSIPASAVQGAVLAQISRTDPSFAESIFKCPQFRFWPLQPASEIGGPQPEDLESLNRSVRVSITHRVAKILDDPMLQTAFADEAIDYSETPAGVPMKSADGVLLWARPQGTTENAVQLWQSSQMRREYVTRGVHSDPNSVDGRNVYSLEAMSPLIWRGVMVGPTKAIERMQTLDGITVRIGKQRATCGTGMLRLLRVDPYVFLADAVSRRIFIAQSPVQLPDNIKKNHATALFSAIAQDWVDKFKLGSIDELWASAGIKFGWNRHQESPDGNDAYYRGRTRATRVVQPGAVIRLKDESSPERILAALAGGMGGGREAGFGALLPHPGKALSAKRRSSQTPRLQSAVDARELYETAIAIRQAAAGRLSPSQVAELLQRPSRDAMRKFLDERENRPVLIRNAWRSSKRLFGDLLNKDEQFARQVLKVVRDLLPAKQQVES